MNSEMLFDALRSLELRWRDLAAVFQRLAETIAVNPPPPVTVAPGVLYWLYDLVGLDNTPPGAPASLRERALAEAGLIETALDALLAVPNRPTNLLLLSAAAPLGTINVFEQSRTRPLTGLGDILAGANPVPGFETLFPDPATNPGTPADTVQIRACRDALVELRDFYARSLNSFRELNDATGFTQRFDIRGIRGSVDNLSAYPILTSDGGGRVAPNGNGGGASARDSYSLRHVVQGAIRGVLGRSPKPRDTKSFVSALTLSFEAAEVEGRTEYTWTPRSFAGQADLGGGVTGGQASLATRAQVSLDQAVPLLEGLFALREDADDELVEATRSIVRNEFTEAVDELGTEGGPRIARVDGLFEMLLAQTFPVAGQPQPALGHLGLLQYELGLYQRNVNTLEEEANFTNFIALSDYIRSVEVGWRTFRDQILGTDLGTRFVQLSRALSVAADAVGEVYDAMDSVYVGEAERQVASFTYVALDPATAQPRVQRVQVGELLSWVSDFASEEAPRLVQEGGRRGAEALIPTAQRLRGLVERLSDALRFRSDQPDDLPDGMRQPRVLNPLRELLGHLRRVERLASDVRQT